MASQARLPGSPASIAVLILSFFQGMYVVALIHFPAARAWCSFPSASTNRSRLFGIVGEEGQV
jgi:hypothetical protein